jgi:hypothetical protein
MLNEGQALGLLGNGRGVDCPDADGRYKGAVSWRGSSARHVSPVIRNLGLVLSLISLTACGTTRQFVEQPHLIIDQSQEDVRQAVTELYGQETPYMVKLCEADALSKECKVGSKGITATGVGGLLLPLTLHVKGIVVSRESQSVEGLAFDASVDATVDAIPPWCGTVKGKIVSRENNTATLELRNFYCNWAVVGNVIVNADLSIDSINLKDRVFTGFYKVTFHGTGNAGGSGYYKAVITAKES